MNLIIWDYDHSLIDDNSDTFIPAALIPSDAETFIRAGLSRGVQWTRLMDDVCGHMHSQGVTASSIISTAASVPVHASILAIIRAAGALAPHTAMQRILSDANTVYIHSFLEHHGLTPFFSAVHTNPASFDAAGRLRVSPAHTGEPHSCARCPVNLCKGAVLRRWLSTDFAHTARPRCIYVGDGAGDACPSLELEEGDVILAREGFALAKLLRQHPPRARVHEWRDGADVHRVIADVLRL